jgi:cob(I)alamin adenosyltransferase
MSILMGYIALYPGLMCPDIAKLEEITQVVGEVTGKTFRFVRPGDSTPGAALHVARTVARRAERIAVKLFRSGELADDAYQYVNRLSDVIYALSLWYDHLERQRREEDISCV